MTDDYKPFKGFENYIESARFSQKKYKNSELKNN